MFVNDRSRIICRPHQITQCPPIPPLLFLEFSVVGLLFLSFNCRGCLLSLPLRCSLVCSGLLGILGLSGWGFLIPQCREPGIGVSDLGQFVAYLGIVMESRTCCLSTLDSADELSCPLAGDYKWDGGRNVPRPKRQTFWLPPGVLRGRGMSNRRLQEG